jgi:hypothetical protein
MEVSPGQPTQLSEFRRTGNFEVNDIEYRDISVDHTRVLAKGKKSEHFELSIASINGMKRKKWKRFGSKLLALGIVLLLSSLIGPFLFGSYLYMSSEYMFISFFMLLGLVVITIWLVAKREELQIYTPDGVFKLEGSAGFVDDIWKAIRNEVRWEIQ